MKSFLPRGLAIVLFGVVSVCAAQKQAGTGPSFKGPIGLQMYSLRFYAPTNAIAKLEKAKELGFNAIEGGGLPRMSPEESVKVIEQHGLKLVSTGADYNRLKNDADAAVAQAKALGAKYVMCSWIDRKRVV